jgi:hypothetical protein
MDFGTRRRRYAGLEEGQEQPEFIEIDDKPWYRRRSIQALLVAAAIALVIGVILAIALPGTALPPRRALLFCLFNLI